MRTESFAVSDASHTAWVRREIVNLVERSGFDAARRGVVAIVAGELASNLVKHAREGHVLATVLERGECEGVELVALDKGPGIRDVSEALRDGFSTAGSLGHGLGSVKRLSDAFDVFTQADRGTAVLSRIWRLGARAPCPGEVPVGGVCLRHVGETAYGDGWAVAQGPRGTAVIVTDGLGHGTLAATASEQAIAAFRKAASLGAAETLSRVHAELRATRGAAVAVAAIDRDARTVHFAGLGNIVGLLVTAEGSRRQMVSLEGIAGHSARRIQEFSYPVPTPGVMVMHSDGVSARWDAAGYETLWTKDPSLIAAVLHRDHARDRDDATVVVARF